MTFKSLSLVLCLAAAAGCASSAGKEPDDPVGPGPGPGPGSGSGSATPMSVDAAGKYQLQSTFDIASNMPGTVGTVVNQIIAATDDPSDPTKWVLDQMLSQMSSGTIKSILQTAEPFVASYLNDQLLQIAPDFVTTAIAAGNNFGDMAKHFGLNETLEVSKTGAEYTAVHTAVGMHFDINGQAFDLPFADYQLQNVVANNLAVQLDSTGKLSIGEHKLPLSYGKMLRIGLDTAIIPTLDPYATNLDQLLEDHIDCYMVGINVEYALYYDIGIDFGSDVFEQACHSGLQVGADTIYQQIANIDQSALEFDVTGTAKAVDTDHDYKIDSIQTGKWAGTLSYSGTPAPLSTATFTGARM